MDQSQKAAEPLTPVKPSTFVRQSLQPEPDPNDSPEAQENRQRAAGEISMIFELKDNRAFQWFEKEFIDVAYQEAFDKLRNPTLRQKDESLELIQAQYVVLRKVKAGRLEREIAHRELLDANDEEIALLRSALERL